MTRTLTRISIIPLIFAFLALAAVMPKINLNYHAEVRHGTDAEQIRDCLSQNGPAQVWKKMNSDRFIVTCQLDDGRWGLQIIQRAKGAWQEVTSFVKGNGTLEELRNYLTSQAIPFKGGLP